MSIMVPTTRIRISAVLLFSLCLMVLGAEKGTAQCLTPPGDITGNGNTDVVDIQCSILATLAGLGETSAPDCLTSQDFNDPDLNCDGELSVVDIILNIELAFDSVLAEDTNSNGWIDSCTCDLGTPPPPPSDICISATDEDMESLCAAEQGILDTSPGAGVADSVVVCDGDDWWLPEAVEWSPDGTLNIGYGYPCILEDGCNSNQGYRHTRSRGTGLTSHWAGMEVSMDDFVEGTHIPITFEDGSQYAWSMVFITLLYNHNEKACITACKEFKEAEFADMVAAGEDLSPYDENGAFWYAKNECADTKSDNPWEAVLAETSYQGLCIWEDWENQELYLPLWAGITGGHCPDWLGEEPYNVPTMLEAFEEYCDSVTSWPCSDYLLYDSVTNPTPANDQYFAIVDDAGDDVDTGIPISATTLNTMMTEWVRDDAYAFWYVNNEGVAVWYEETGKFLQRLGQVLEIYDTHDLMKHFQIMGEGGRWTNYPPMGFRTLDELAGDLDSLWNMAEESGIPTEKFVFNVSQGTRAHRDTIDKAEEVGAGIATHSAGRLIVSQMAFQYPHLAYHEDLLSYRVVGDLPFTILHSDLELFKTTNTFGEYRLLREFVLGSIAVGANSLLMTDWAVPSYGTYAITTNECDLDDPFYDLDGNEIDGFGSTSDGTFEMNWTKYQDEKDCWNEPGNCERPCMFHWDEIKDQGPADFLEWMNHALGRVAEGSPQAYVALYQRGAANPHEESIEEQLAEKYAGCPEDYPNLPVPYDDNWCQLEECTLTNPSTTPPTTETQLCYNSWWDAHEEKHLRSALLVQHAHHMFFNRNLNGGAGTPDRYMDGSIYGDMLIGGKGNNMTNWTNGLDYPYEARSTWVPGSTGGDALFFDLEDAFVNSGIKELGSTPIEGYVVKVTFAPAILESEPTPVTETYNPGSDSGQFRLEYHSTDGWKEGPTVCFDNTDTGFKTATFHLTDAAFGQGGENTFYPAGWFEGVDPTVLADMAIRHVEGAHASYQLIRVIKIPAQ